MKYSQSWNDTYKMMEKGEMRNLRPDKLPRLNRAFDIDCEAKKSWIIWKPLVPVKVQLERY